MPRRLALLIGAGTYDAPGLKPLSTPPHDVSALATLLRDPELGGFDEVKELVDVPEVQIRRALSAFFRHGKREDLLLVYFSGHGLRDERGRLFWATRDTDPDDLSATGVPASYVSDQMDASTSRRQVLVLDCCFGGAFVEGGKGGDRVLTQSTFEGSGYGRVVLTASDSTQFAREGAHVVEQARLSLFTHFLIEGLSTGAAAKPGAQIITLNDWYEYAYEQVVGENAAQTPCKWVYNQKGDLVIARNPRPTSAPQKEIPTELMESLRDPRTWIRLGAVEEVGKLLRSDAAFSDAATRALQSLADDDSLRVREAAASTLVTVQPDPAQAVPRSPLGDGQERTNGAAVAAGNIGAEGVRTPGTRPTGGASPPATPLPTAPRYVPLLGQQMLRRPMWALGAAFAGLAFGLSVQLYSPRDGAERTDALPTQPQRADTSATADSRSAVTNEAVESAAADSMATAADTTDVSLPESHVRPLRIGSSIGGITSFNGRLGAFARDRSGARFVLMVMLGSSASDFRRGAPIIQPATSDGGEWPRDEIGKVERLLFLDDYSQPAAYLIALVRINDGVSVDPSLPGTSLRGVRPYDRSLRREWVRVYGDLSGEPAGVIWGTDVLFTFRSPIDPDRNRMFVNFMTANQLKGDPGALVVDPGNRAVGLIFGVRGGTSTLIVPLEPALKAYGVELLTGGAPGTP
jgi:hypothetical protein